MDQGFASPITTQELKNSILDIVLEFCSHEKAHAVSWHIRPPSDASQPWIHVVNERVPMPGQGWKLHVSASNESARQVLRCVLPVLLAEVATFKVLSSIHLLDGLNQGHGGLSQIGKFITVYPHDDAQAVRLAVALHMVTRGLLGPSIPSDRPLTPDSLVHYRFGSFTHQTVQTKLGEILPAIRNPDGELIPDRRLPVYHPPEWAVDPYMAAGIAAELPKQSLLLAKRYLVLATLHQSQHSTVYLAVDIVAPRRCIIKRAGLGAVRGASQCEAHNRLRHEAKVLARLACDPGFPILFDLFEQDREPFVVMQEFDGKTLNQYIARHVGYARLVPPEQVVAWGRELATLLATIHAKGFIYRDLKSTNVIVTPDERLHLIDFGLAQERSSLTPRFGFGTRGYMSPQQEVGDPADITDDIYGLGALLYFIATGAEPSRAPHPFALIARPLLLMNPTIGLALVQLIERCLDPNPSERYPSMEALASALTAIGAEATRAPLPNGSDLLVGGDTEAQTRYRLLARRLGDTLCRAAQRESDGQGLAWVNTHNFDKGLRSRDLNAGSSGEVLALADLVAEYGDPEHIAVLEKGAHWLIRASRPQGPPLPGLYVGESGIGVALLRAGQVLYDRELLTAAEERSHWIATLPMDSPDLFHGIAGRARFHLLLWDETAKLEHLRYAIMAGEALLAAAKDVSGSGHEIYWVIPPDYGGLSGSAYLGYAHGAAGIADVLLDLFEATDQERFLTAAQGAGRWLARLGVPVLDDETGLGWPTVEGKAPSGAFWCHGATGIGRFFLHAAQLDILKEAADLAARAARTVAHGTRWCGPTQCHGLAGNIEFLIDMAQMTGDHSYLTEARVLARLLEAFAVEKDGILTWPSESSLTFTPDYMVGYAGIAVCLLRLGNPEHRPHLLSRQGFRYHPKVCDAATSAGN